jgi:outer membrane protein OmpA-like peptidoglycan-associated protein
MLGLASEAINRDPRTKPVMIYQLTWSVGDHMVARENVKTLNDLRGKKVCLQADGPHLGLVDDSLKAANLTWNDITVVYAKNLTGDDSPSAMMRADQSIDVACVITPDMLGLCSAIDQKGSGAEGTLKGAHVINSTASMSRSISDVYVVRQDYWDKHRSEVQKFFVGYLQATEQLLEYKRVYNDGKGVSPKYMAALTLAQQVYGQKALPTIEVDAHGLVSDAVFVRLGGNELFFNDANNLVGFQVKQNESLEMAYKLGYIKDKFGFVKADWDYKTLAQAAGIQYVKPTYSQGHVKGEVTEFNKDLDTNTIVSFEIKFEPDQTTFSVDAYAADFQRVTQSLAKFGNCAYLVRGHSDPTLSLQNFVWAARAKGLITGDDGNYKFKGSPFNLLDTRLLLDTIRDENLGGLKRKNRDGEIVPIDDPKMTVAAALTLSQNRAGAVKRSIQEYAKSKGIPLDLSQVQPVGVGIAEPIHARPRNMQQARENMRVEFRLIRVKAEALTDDNFNFDK